MVEIVNCDLFDTESDGIAHSVNCHGVWGKGLAKEMKKWYPRAYTVDCMTLRHNPKKLGTFSYIAPIGTGEKDDKWVFSIAGQFNYGTDKQYTDYSALLTGFESLKDFILKVKDKPIFTLALPFGLGAGLGGGDFKVILDMIKYVFEKEDGIKVLICKI